jgi:PTS system N-acetylglucosamine-specific IIB component
MIVKEPQPGAVCRTPMPISQEDPMSTKAEQILAGLGGSDNIVEMEACITRLRTEVNDGSKVDQAALKAAGAHGVMVAGNAVQVIVGPEADTLAEDIEDLM